MPMIMTEKLANSLMDNLACLALSATGTDPFDERAMALAEDYAKKTFMFICSEWEDLTGEEWQVSVGE